MTEETATTQEENVPKTPSEQSEKDNIILFWIEFFKKY